MLVGRGVHFANRYVARIDSWPHETVRTSLSGPMAKAGQPRQAGPCTPGSMMNTNHIDKVAHQCEGTRRASRLTIASTETARSNWREAGAAMDGHRCLPLLGRYGQRTCGGQPSSQSWWRTPARQGEPEGRSCCWDPIHPSGWTTRGLCTSLRARSTVQWTSPGGVAERLNAPVLKTGSPSRGSWVRIPPPPPDT